MATAAADAPLAGGAPAPPHAEAEGAAAPAAPDDDDDLITPVPSPTATLQPPDSPDELPDDDAVARRWLRRSDLAPLRDRPDFGVLIAGFFVRVQRPGVVPPVHALLQIRSVRYRSRAYELLTARAARGGRPEYAFQELELEDDSMVTLNSVSNRPLGAPEVAELRARVDAGQLRWPCGSRVARATLDAAAAALVAEREARSAARLEARLAEAAAAAAAAPPVAEPHPDTGINEYGQMDVGAVLSKLNDADAAPLLPVAPESALVSRVEAPAPLPQPLPIQRRSPADVLPFVPAPPPGPCAVVEKANEREGSLPLWEPPAVTPAAPSAAVLAPAPAEWHDAPPPAAARRQSRWDTALPPPPPPPPPRPTRDRTASPEALPAAPVRVDPYGGGAVPAALGLGAELQRSARAAAAAAAAAAALAPPPPRAWQRRSGERSPSRRRSPSPPRRYASRSPSPRWRPSRSRSPTRHAGRSARERSRERAYAWDEQKAAGAAAPQWVPGSAEPVRASAAKEQWQKPKPQYPVFGSGKIQRKSAAEMLAHDAIIKAQRAAGECIDPTPTDLV